MKAEQKDVTVRIFPQDVELTKQIGAKLFPGLKVPDVIRLVLRHKAESLGIKVA